MDTHLTSIPTHFGDPRAATTTPYRAEAFAQRIVYRNYLGVPVSLGLRNGLKIRLEPEPNLEVREFITVLELTMDSQVKTDVHRVLSSMDTSVSAELSSFKQSLSLQLGNKHGAAQITMHYPLTLDQLETAGGTVYFSEVDIVVSLVAPEFMPPHPSSEEGRRSQTIAGSPIEHGGAGFGYAVEIVDNHARYGDRYLNIAGQVYKVSTKKDFSRRDGVYIISNYAAIGELERKATQVTYCAFDQAQETLGLYRTYDEALHLGDLSQARKAELLSLEHRLNVERSEYNSSKLASERQLLDAKTELARLEGDNARLLARNQLLERDMEIERQKNKDAYEQRSQNRKDASETIKILPTILLGVATLVGTILGIVFGGGKKAG